MQKASKTWQERRKDYLIAAIICLIIGIYYFIKVTNESYIINPAELNTIEKLVISEKPTFKKTGGKHKRKWIEFKCVQNYSTFKIISYDYSCALRSEIVDEIKPGDTISIQVLNKEMDNFDTENVCEIHSLIKYDKEYIDTECRNKTDNDSGKRSCIMLLAISLICCIVYAFKNKPPLFDHIDENFMIGIIIAIFFIILLSLD